jgi:hypothetical protein
MYTLIFSPNFFSCFLGENKFKILFYKKGIMQLISADAIVFSKKYKPPKTFKNHPQKLLIIGPDPFMYFKDQPRPQPRIDFSYYEISGPDICSLICAAGPVGSTKKLFCFVKSSICFLTGFSPD